MIRVFIVCSGLGNINRGYESFSQECFDHLSKERNFEIYLFKGKGKSTGNTFSVPNLSRKNKLAKAFGRIICKESYFIEQITFSFFLIPHILKKKPDIIYYSDFYLGTFLWHLRRFTNFKYKLLFSNGAPNGPPFSRMDYVQHLTPHHNQIAINAGESPDKHFLVPYGINIKDNMTVLSQNERHSLCNRLNIPLNRLVVLSVGTINKTHKRMDYLITEIAKLPKPKPFLVVLGQQDNESEEIIRLGQQILGSENFQALTVSYNELESYYKASNIFILCSLNEGLPRVLLEAMSYGLPCLAHDYNISRYVLSDKGYFSDFTKTGSLLNLITQVISKTDDIEKKIARHRFIYERFSWDNLVAEYIKMINQCVSIN